MYNITELKEKCGAIERCLPVSDFREQVAKTHSEMFEYISALESENKRLEAECDKYNQWRAKQIPAWESVCDEWKAKCEKLEAERDAWKTAITVFTPNDADFTDDPHACAGYIRTKLNFGITDRFADAGKVMEGGDSVRNETA